MICKHIGSILALTISFLSMNITTQVQTWTQLLPSGSIPSTRYQHCAIYDATNNRMTIFGGNVSGNFLNDTWVLSNANGLGGIPAWTQITTTGILPSPRRQTSAVYDTTNNFMIIFGGYDGSHALNDVWVLSTSNGLGSATSVWTQLSPTGSPPSGRYSQTAVYDAADNRMTIFSGYNGSQLNDVWVLSNANGLGGTPAWSQLSPTGSSPAIREGSTATYDAVHNRMTIFGGGTGGYLNDVWVLSNANGLGGTPAWSQLSTTGSSPTTRWLQTAIYDTTNNRMTIFGGQHSGGGYLNDVWVLSNANGLGGTASWTQIVPLTGSTPAIRFLQTAVYDNTNNLMTIFGGYGSTGTLNDVWVLSRADYLTPVPKRIWKILDN